MYLFTPGGRTPGTVRPLRAHLSRHLPQRPSQIPDGCAIRVLTPDRRLGLKDEIQGPYAHNLARETGDFIIRRRDGLTSYQLAVVLDDAAQGVTQVMRGSDLLSSTPRQILLQGYLGLPTPDYGHLPVAVRPGRGKLSKQTGASALPQDDPLPALVAALSVLGQRPPPELLEATIDELWAWALVHWRTRAIPRTPTVPAPPALDRRSIRDWLSRGLPQER